MPTVTAAVKPKTVNNTQILKYETLVQILKSSNAIMRTLIVLCHHLLFDCKIFKFLILIN